LNVGAGNSEISERLYFQGFDSITNVDYSREVVNAMLKRYSDLNCKIDYLEMDMKKLVFEHDHFDIVLDLGGSDCLLCSRNPLGDYRIFIQEVYRVLKGKGLYIRISLFKDIVKYDLNQYIDNNKFVLVETLTTEMKGDRIFIFDKKSQEK
jgi:ubiquinone/menaquinone biosynthesis C-methylase UbiE